MRSVPFVVVVILLAVACTHRPQEITGSDAAPAAPVLASL